MRQHQLSGSLRLGRERHQLLVACGWRRAKINRSRDDQPQLMPAPDFHCRTTEHQRLCSDGRVRFLDPQCSQQLCLLDADPDPAFAQRHVGNNGLQDFGFGYRRPAAQGYGIRSPACSAAQMAWAVVA